MDEELDVEINVELNDLPKGWEWLTLGDVCQKPQYGWTTKADRADGTVKLLRTTDITSGEIDWSTVPYCTEVPEDLDKYLLESGDIVISRAGSVGVSYLLTSVEPAVFASYLIRFRPKAEVDERYVAYYLRSSIYWEAIGASKSGIALANVNAKKLARVPFPLAPLPEQRRIVSAIETQLGRLDAAVARLQAAKAKLKRYKQAVLKAAVEGRLTNLEVAEGELPERWTVAPFSSVATVKSNLVSPKDYQSLPHIAPDNIERETGQLLAFKTIAEDEVISPKHYFRKGQILYSKIRPYLNKLVLAPFDGLCSADMYPIESTLDTEYMFYYMLSENFVFQAATAGSRSVLPKINQEELARVRVNVPASPKEQRTIAKRVREVLSGVNGLDATLDAQLLQSTRLRQAVLKRAFEGRLIYND